MENIDFSKIAFNSVKRYLVQGYSGDVTDIIMDDFVAGGDFENSFAFTADLAGLYIAEEIFNEFLTDEALEACKKAWEKAS